MKHKKETLLTILLGTLLITQTGCFTTQITYPAYFTPENDTQKIFFCRPYTDRKMWYIVGNSFGINRPGIPEIFPESNRFYRIQERKTTADLLITIFLGTFTSITRSTLFIDECRVRGEKGFLDEEFKKPTIAPGKAADPKQ